MFLCHRNLGILSLSPGCTRGIEPGSPITPVGDDIVEGIEAIIVQGTAPGLTVTPATIYLRDQNTATGDPDTATLSLSGPNTVLNEGEDASFTVTLSHAVGSQIRVAWSVTPGTATSEDYRRSSGQTTFPAGSEANATQPFNVSIRDDGLSENEESLNVSLGAVSGRISDQVSVDSAASSTTVTISESDPITVVLSGPASVGEGEPANYRVSLSPSGIIPTEDLTVDYTTSDGTAHSDNYTAASGILTFSSSDAGTQSIAVSTTEDTSHEEDQTFSFTISNLSGGGGPMPSLGNRSSITTTITDDDPPPSPPRNVIVEPGNNSPRFDEGARTIRTVLEAAKVGTVVGERLRARDSDNDRLEYWLWGTDRESFDVDLRTGQLTTKTALDYEVKDEYSVRVSVRDGQRGSDGIIVLISVENVDEPPGPPAALDLKATSHSTLAVNWTAPDNQGPEIIDYDVRYREEGGEFYDAAYDGNGTSIALEDLHPETRYEVQVRAVNAEGTGFCSESSQRQTKPPPDPTTTHNPAATPGPSSSPAPAPPTTDDGDGGFPWWGIVAIVVGAIATGVTVVGAHRKWGTNGAPANVARRVALTLRTTVRWVATSSLKTLAYDGARVVVWSTGTPPAIVAGKIAWGTYAIAKWWVNSSPRTMVRDVVTAVAAVVRWGLNCSLSTIAGDVARMVRALAGLGRRAE